MNNIISLPLIQCCSHCFKSVTLSELEKIAQVWRCTVAAFHLQQAHELSGTENTDSIQLRASKMYERECLRILASLFPLDHEFWKTYYSRLENYEREYFIALDALYYMDQKQSQICYQLLLQGLKSIFTAHYSDQSKKEEFSRALQLLEGVEVPQMHQWIREQITLSTTL